MWIQKHRKHAIGSWINFKWRNREKWQVSLRKLHFQKAHSQSSSSAQNQPKVRITRFLGTLQYQEMLDVKNVRELNTFDSTYILLTYSFGSGMPPEIPFPVATD